LGSVLGPKTYAPGGYIFQSFRSFWVPFLERRLLRKPCFLRGKSKVVGFILGPKTDPFGDRFSKLFVIFKTLFGSKNANSLIREAVFAPQLGAPKNCFFKVSWTSILAPCWFRLGLLLGPAFSGILLLLLWPTLFIALGFACWLLRFVVVRLASTAENLTVHASEWRLPAHVRLSGKAPLKAEEPHGADHGCQHLDSCEVLTRRTRTLPWFAAVSEAQRWSFFGHCLAMT